MERLIRREESQERKAGLWIHLISTIKNGYCRGQSLIIEFIQITPNPAHRFNICIHHLEENYTVKQEVSSYNEGD